MIAPAPQPFWHHLPVINACLNATSALLLIGGFVMIKQKRVIAHRNLMIAAFGTSTAFLACYLTYHHYLKSRTHELITTFPAGAWRFVYMPLLTSHTILAVVILPLIAASFWLAWKRRWKLHHKISMVTLPLWLYVSVTGVVVYWMLYHLAPTLRR